MTQWTNMRPSQIDAIAWAHANIMGNSPTGRKDCGQSDCHICAMVRGEKVF